MKSRHILLVPVVFLACAWIGTAVATEVLRIDDRTVLDPASGRLWESPLSASLPAGPVGGANGWRSLSDGIVGCSTSDSYFPFDLDSHVPGAAVSLLPEGDYPYDATMNPAGTEVWIPGASGDGVVVIDRATNLIVQRIPVANYIISVAFSNDGSLALVSSRDDENISVINTATYAVVSTLPIPTSYLGAGNLALDPISGLFYLVDWYGDDLYEIAADGSAVLDQVTLGSSLWQLVVSPDGQFVYLTDRGTDQVRVIERATLTEVQNVPVGDDPWGIDVTGDGAKLVVACEDDHTVRIVDTSTWGTTTLDLDPTADPRDVDIHDQQSLAFVVGGRVGTTSNPVYLVDLTADTLQVFFEGTGSNTNVIAVQPQMHATGSAVPGGGTAGLVRDLVAGPNPFNPRTRIAFTLIREAPVEAAIFDLEGRRIRGLAGGVLPAGPQELFWDGRDEAGRPVGSGVYSVRLTAGAEPPLSLKVVLLK